MKIIIWGTGNSSYELCQNGICGEIIGFVESNKSKEEYLGYKVYAAEEMPDKYDFLIVASIYSDEIYEKCQQLKLDSSKLVFIRAGIHIAFNNDRRLRGVLGEKNYTQYAASYGIWKNTFFEDDRKQYEEMNMRTNFRIRDDCLYPIISDKYGTNSGFTTYFWQDLWAAKRIIADGIQEHYDIGSRVDGFIAHLLAADIRVNMIDVRPFNGGVQNLYTIVDDATMLNQFEDNSLGSLSALCSLEHFGLGRYGDPIDPEACFKCFAQIQKKLMKGGKAYISVPVGPERVAFNAHRIYYASTILECFSDLKLVEYSVIARGTGGYAAIDYYADIHRYDTEDATGLFCFEK